jgi:hypothetical protein
MAQFHWDMSHDFNALHLRTAPDIVPEHGRELDRRRRPLGDGTRPSLDPVRARAFALTPAAGTGAVGRAVWESAVRARRLGNTVALIQDDNDAAPLDDRPGRAVVTAWLAGLSLWAIVLFLIGME